MRPRLDPGNGRRVFRFGPFALDSGAGELKKGGIPVKLETQPAEVLRMLLERPGELVTREEIRNYLWPGERIGDADDALSTAVRKIRVALSDSADKPRYIETLPKRGYRFVGEIDLPAPPVMLQVTSRVKPVQ